ncbi:MAG: AMP-binding protein [Actinomycetota bacterium]|nr:AMP-binding protein [Actinomycetota bacterium]
MSLCPVDGEPGEVFAELRDWWQAPDGPLVVRTSGSSGTARNVALSHAALLASATASQRRLGGPAAWVLALPVTFVAGLQVLVRSLLAGTSPVLFGDHDGDWPAALAVAEKSAGDAGVHRRCTALVPTQLHRLAREHRLGEIADLDAVLVGGAGVDAELLADARAAGVRVVTTYGMTETCGGCVYDGEPLDGVAVRVASDRRVHLAGPCLFDGYPEEPAATAEALVDGWLRTQDLGHIDDDGRLHVLGRVDDVVVSGGVNVALPAVERALRSHPRVADVAAAGVADPEWGTRVVVVVQPDGPAPTLDELRDHVAASLPRTWAPRGLTLVDRLPVLPNGKPDRVAAVRLARAC